MFYLKFALVILFLVVVPIASGILGVLFLDTPPPLAVVAAAMVATAFYFVIRALVIASGKHPVKVNRGRFKGWGW